MQEARRSNPPVVTEICDPCETWTTTPSQREAWLEIKASQKFKLSIMTLSSSSVKRLFITNHESDEFYE